MKCAKQVMVSLVAGAAVALSGCGREAGTAPETDAPVTEVAEYTPTWSSAQKFGIGSSYEAYLNGAYSDDAETGVVSKVWFSLNRDRISEVMAGLIHEAQIREIRLVVTDAAGEVIPVESSRVEYLSMDEASRPTAPAYALILEGEGGAYTLKQEIVTDPDRQSLLVRVSLDGDSGLRVFALVDTALGNTGTGDTGSADASGLSGQDGDAALFVGSDAAFVRVGAVALTGQAVDLAGEWPTSLGEAGDLVLVGELSLADGQQTLAVGFGETVDAARTQAEGAIGSGFDALLADYAAGWAEYLAGLEHLERLAGESGDGGALLYSSALAIKVMEDKTHAGALIASLSNPWGLTASAATPQTGYKAVWPRDFYQVAMAFLALGDEETAAAAMRYLPQIQVNDATPGNAGATGWFLQKTHVDGEIEWVAVQLDQTAMPIMLAYRLWQARAVGEDEIAAFYAGSVVPAADFLIDGGRPDILWNNEFEVVPPLTQQERWEEQFGYSPSTTAAVIAGLVTAAEMADAFGTPEEARRYRAAADRYQASIKDWMVTKNGQLEGAGGRYFIRITQNTDPNDRAPINPNNGREAMAEDLILDPGFLELVRYGVLPAEDPDVVATLAAIDDQTRDDTLRVRYGDGFRRYGNDGYGEDTERGTNYAETGENTPGQRGRIWPFLTGERAHYGIAAGEMDVSWAVSAMERYANEGLMLPEQVWDGVGVNPWGYEEGEGTDSATPLAWTHAEYIKLLRSLSDGQVWDFIPAVAERYVE